MSLSARSRWTWRRASSPVIHFDSPDGSAILPSIDSASLSVMRGRPRCSRVSQPDSERFAASRPTPTETSIPAARRRRIPLPDGPRVGIPERDHDARRLCGDQQIRAGRAAFAGVRARLERHVDGRALRPLAGLLECDRLRMRPSAGSRRAPADDLAGPGDDHAADIGIGGERPRALRRARYATPCTRGRQSISNRLSSF